jgi:hypothetical protein
VWDYPLHISLIAEGHRDRNSRYVFEDRLFAAPAVIAYDFAVTLQKTLHRISYSDDQHPIVDIERESAPFGKRSAATTGCALIKLSISRGWTTDGVWQAEHRTIALFELEDDAEAFAREHPTKHHEAVFADKWLSEDG